MAHREEHRGQVKQHFTENKRSEDFLSHWTTVIDSRSEGAFNANWSEMEREFADVPAAISYVRRTWLPHKAAFVRAWADRHFHAGSRTSSRVEGVHAVLKLYLRVSTGDLLTVGRRIMTAVSNQHHEVTTEIASQRIRAAHEFNDSVFARVTGKVSLHALRLAQAQLSMADNKDDIGDCTGLMTSSMGVPCKHRFRQLRRIANGSLSIGDFHEQWVLRTTSNIPPVLDDSDRLENAIQHLGTSVSALGPVQMRVAIERIHGLARNPVPEILDPVPVITRGRPRGSRNTAASSTRRERSEFERVERRVYRCRRCNKEGHNSRSCRGP